METIEVKGKKGAKRKKLLSLLLKCVVTALCFWYISSKIDLANAFAALQDARWWLLFFSAAAYVLSKLLSAIRLNIYFRNIRLHLPAWQNIRLYWLGMFYNLFLPGSISGDAYKVVLLHRRFGASYKKTGAAVLLDRFSGLLGLGVILSVYGILVFKDIRYDAFLFTGCLLALATLYFVIRRFFPDFLPGFLPTFLWGIVVQAIQVAGIYLILAALHVHAGHREWIFIFLAASVIAVFPLSLGGGLGTREFVFVEGATFFHLDPHLALVISLLFYLSSVAGSVWGAYYVFRDPLHKKGQPVWQKANDP